MTFKITENLDHGWINIDATIEHTDGRTNVGKTIREYSIGRKVEAITKAVEEIIRDFQKESVHED